ncbi:phage tail protein [Clostridium botulinum]|uniref:phage tail protein n=1 Tax=Clostridium botulinum TaxID=1491 RepID=UPI0014006390|nr:phage tail protein [Clostridium botulinum]MBY6915495.1 phage tail protein [Clostridium botulinum]NFQ38288.1 hypothetical protein [Clostridium botulinum]
MQEENFGSILTNIGKAKVANATLLNGNIALKTLKVGDSNGTYYNPTEDQVELRNTVYECAVGAIKIDTNNPNWITVETLLPGNIGGFTIREVGLFDADGDMIVVGKYPETYKPLIENGASKDINVRIIFEVSNTENVTLNTNPSVIIATKEDVNNLQEQIENNTTQLKDCAKKTDLDNYYSLVNATKIATGTDILTLPFGNYVSTESEITETLVNCPTKGSGFVMKVERITGGIQGNFKRLNIKCNNKTSDTFINTLVDTQWSGWKQLATVDDTGWITLHLEGKVIAYESYQTPIYRKINNTVEIIGAIKDVTNFNTNNNVIFATLPTGFRSKKDFRILCQGSNKDSWLLTVTESGMLKGSRYGMNGLASSMDGTEWLPFHIVFTV